MSEQKSVFEKTKRAISRVDMTEQARIPLNKEPVYLRVEGDFTNGRDEARFSYSLDGKAWIPVGLPIKMKFDYTRMFMEMCIRDRGIAGDAFCINDTFSSKVNRGNKSSARCSAAKEVSW